MADTVTSAATTATRTNVLAATGGSAGRIAVNAPKPASSEAIFKAQVEDLEFFPDGYLAVGDAKQTMDGRTIQNRDVDINYIGRLVKEIYAGDKTFKIDATGNFDRAEVFAAVKEFQHTAMALPEPFCTGIVAAPVPRSGIMTRSREMVLLVDAAKERMIERHNAPPAATDKSAATGGIARSGAPLSTTTTKDEPLWVNNSFKRAEVYYHEEILGGVYDITSAFKEGGDGNLGTVIQGVGEIAGGVVRGAGTVFSYPMSFVDRVADIGADYCFDAMSTRWKEGGWAGYTLAVLWAIGGGICKGVSLAFGAAAALVDVVAKFFGETIVEGPISWLGGLVGGKDVNESDFETSEREKIQNADREKNTHRRLDDTSAQDTQSRDVSDAQKAKNAIIAERKSDVAQAQREVKNFDASIKDCNERIAALQKKNPKAGSYDDTQLTVAQNDMKLFSERKTIAEADLAKANAALAEAQK